MICMADRWVRSLIANDGVPWRNEQSVGNLFAQQTMLLAKQHQPRRALGERLLLIHRVRSNKALLLTRVTEQ